MTLAGVTELELFDPTPYVVEPPPKLSYTRRVTERQKQLVLIGVHPLAHRPTRPDLGTCGDCVFRQLKQHNDRRYPKCTFDPDRVKRSHNTDCRAWWPACPDHKKQEPA